MYRRDFIGAVGALIYGGLSGCSGRAIVAGSAGGASSVALSADDYHATRKYASTRFGRIAYIERGAGDAVLFLHGFPLNSFQWRGAIPRLASHRRCVAPDFLGLGYTEVAPGQSVAPSAQVEMLATFLDALSIRTVDVIANDSGGQAAQLFLAAYPERVRTLLLTNCDTEIDSPPPALKPVIDLSREGKFVDQWLAPWRADAALARSPQGIGGMCYVDPAHPTNEAIEYYFAPLTSSAERKALAHAYVLALEHNPLIGVARTLKASKTPTRIVWGSGDTIFSLESPGYLDKTLGASRGVRLLEGRKLFWPEELPEVIAEEALRLWG